MCSHRRKVKQCAYVLLNRDSIRSITENETFVDELRNHLESKQIESYDIQ